MELEVRHLKLMLAVTEEGGVTKAGQRLHLTQSALSHQLRDIEERLGTALFLRINKKMIPTEAGEKLLQTARLVLNQMEHAETEIGQMAQNRLGTLRLATECYTCYHWLPAVLKSFHASYPGVEVKIVVEATRQPIAALLNGQLDLAIISDKNLDRRLSYHSLFADEMVAVMSPDHPLAGRPYIRARDFAGEHLILYVAREESTLYERLLIPAGVEPARLSQVSLTEAIIEMVRAGLGISVLARWAIRDQLASGRLIGRPVTRKGLHRQWQAATLRRDYAPEYIGAFVDLLARPVMPLNQSGIVRLVSGR
jgi:LysR family transcriptional regulator, regulator for metE and metH